MLLRGEQVKLRPAGPGDIDALVGVLTSPAVIEWWPRMGAAEVRTEILDDDETDTFVVEVDGTVIGFIQSHEESDPMYRHAGIDLALHPDWQGQGYGTDAVRTLARHLIDDRGHHRITIDPATANGAAIRCYEKVGFRRVGIMRCYERGADGSFHDGLLLDLLAQDLDRRPPA